MTSAVSSAKSTACPAAIRMVRISGLSAPHGNAGRRPFAASTKRAGDRGQDLLLRQGLDDSKKLTPDCRERLYDLIAAAAHVGIGIAEVERIDRDNILSANFWAMRQAIARLKIKPLLALVDGNRAPQLACTVQAIIEGDAQCASIAAASIIAKVTRDRLMIALDADCPGYGFAVHKGYGTPEHQSALKRLGPSLHHRRSFAPIRALCR
jgi:ribonuclease HII